MGKIIFTLLLSCWLGGLSAHSSDSIRIPASMVGDTYSGYIITLDQKVLTGRIGDVLHSDFLSNVIFVNDFGTPYRLQAELISGFVFKSEETQVEYRSVFTGPTRTYMEVIEKGNFLTLFKAPEREATLYIDEKGNIQQTTPLKDYWVQIREDKPFELGRLGYKKKLKRILWRFPSVTEKIGRQGYRYKNLQNIIAEVNTIYKSRQRTL